jgi:hypothetical protein
VGDYQERGIVVSEAICWITLSLLQISKFGPPFGLELAYQEAIWPAFHFAHVNCENFN